LNILDYMPLATYVSPALTTVQQDVKIGAEGVVRASPVLSWVSDCPVGGGTTFK